MSRVLAIARLTFWEGVRMRIVLVFLIVLVMLVLYMPFALRGDDTLAGRLQQFLSYSLWALSMFLSLATIFFSCSTLSNEFKQRSLHMVVTKPVARGQILVGKWLGVNLLNVLIVAICGAAIYGFAAYVRSQPAAFERDRTMVRDVVWTARYAASPVAPPDLVERAAQDVRARIETGEVDRDQAPVALRQRHKELVTEWRTVPNGEYRIYRFENLEPPEDPDTRIQIRFSARGSPLPMDEMLDIGWMFWHPIEDRPLMPEPVFTQERTGQRHQFLVNARAVIHDRQAELRVINPFEPGAPTRVIFEGADSLEILYKVGSFEANYVKALLLILLRLALLSAVGLMFSVFVSFPVACLCVGAFYVLCLGYPFWMESIGANLQYVSANVDPYGAWGPYVRMLLVNLLWLLFPDFWQYGGTGPLVDGEYIDTTLVSATIVRTLVYGLILLGVGWLVFRNREIAQVQV